MKLSTASLILGVGSLLSSCTPPPDTPLTQETTTPPNIVLIYTDDVGYGSDAREQQNVAAKHPEVVKEMATLLEEIRQ